MNTLIICNTPYQILNAVNVIVNNVEGVRAESTDILIDMTFNNADIVGEALLNNNLCKDVFFVSKKCEKFKRSKFRCIIDLVTGNFHEEIFDFSDNNVKRKRYDMLWVGDDSPLGLLIFDRNKHSKVYWYDDGVLSYSKAPPALNHAVYDKIASVLKFGGYKYGSKIVYLNNADMVQYANYDIRQLPRYSRENVASGILKKVFDYQKERTVLREYKFIILSQVYPTSAEYAGLDISCLLNNTQVDFSKVLIRKHPRDRQDYQGCVIDNGANMWEIECLENLSNNHILVACCSTAQITPKMLADKEPYIIFLYRILLGDASAVRSGCEKLVNSIRDVYSDKSKVCVPNTLEEFKAEISKLVGEVV